MKKSIYSLCIIALLCGVALVSTSCSEKTRAINNLEDLAEEVQKHGNTYGFSEWQDVFKQYQSITVVIDQHYGEYSQKQRNRINHAKATIKQSAWDAMENKLDMFPAIKQTLMEWYNALFSGVPSTTTNSDE